MNPQILPTHCLSPTLHRKTCWSLSKSFLDNFNATFMSFKPKVGRSHMAAKPGKQYFPWQSEITEQKRNAILLATFSILTLKTNLKRLAFLWIKKSIHNTCSLVWASKHNLLHTNVWPKSIEIQPTCLHIQLWFALWSSHSFIHLILVTCCNTIVQRKVQQ